MRVFKDNIKLIIVVIIICMFFSCITAFVSVKLFTDSKKGNEEEIKLADENEPLFDSSDVNYDNSNSGLNSRKVQGAIDELYNAATDYSAFDSRLDDVEDKLGDDTLNTTSQTITGAINELISSSGNGYETIIGSNYVCIKFDNGIMIEGVQLSKSFAITTAYGSIYSSAVQGTQNWPVAFISKPMAVANEMSTSTCHVDYFTGGNGTYIGDVSLGSATSKGNVSATINIFGIGRWK